MKHLHAHYSTEKAYNYEKYGNTKYNLAFFPFGKLLTLYVPSSQVSGFNIEKCA